MLGFLAYAAVSGVIETARLVESLGEPETQQAIARSIAKGAIMVGKEVVKEVFNADEPR